MASLLSSASLLISSTDSRRLRTQRTNERLNLATFTRLVLRSALQNSTKVANRIIAGDHPQLADLLIMAEKILFHGLLTSDQKSLLSFRTPDADLWNCIVKIVQKTEARSKGLEEDSVRQAIECIQQLETLKTSISKIRGFLRMLFMQKKLADFMALYSHSPYIDHFYEDWAFIRSAEMEPIAGTMVGLAVFNCTLDLEFDHLQNQPQNVDFSHYIQISLPLPLEADEAACNEELDILRKETKILMDQNNYLEERNRFLQDKNTFLSQNKSAERNQNEQEMTFKCLSENEQSLKNELEQVTLLLRSKDTSLKETQAQCESLIEINKDLQIRLQAAEAIKKEQENDYRKLKQLLQQEKDNFRSKLATLMTEAENDKNLKNTLVTISDKYSESLMHLEAKQQELKEVRDDLIRLTNEKAQLVKTVSLMEGLEEENAKMREEIALLKSTITEYELMIEEIGPQLSKAKLDILELKEEILPLCSEWQKDSEVSDCNSCQEVFSLSRRKHHCRICGRIYCAQCSTSRIRVPSSASPVRACIACFQHLHTRYNSST